MKMKAIVLKLKGINIISEVILTNDDTMAQILDDYSIRSELEVLADNGGYSISFCPTALASTIAGIKQEIEAFSEQEIEEYVRTVEGK
jgi:hypothetical protein